MLLTVRSTVRIMGLVGLSAPKSTISEDKATEKGAEEGICSLGFCIEGFTSLLRTG